MNEWADFVTKRLSSVIEILAALIVAIAIVQFLMLYIRGLFKPNIEHNNRRIRIKFGSSLTIVLELLLAADILATAIAPTWDDIGKLAAIATLRTALNYFLERELKETEHRENSGNKEKIIYAADSR